MPDNISTALVAILIERLEALQAGPSRCPDNELALNNLRDAQAWLEGRSEAA